MFLAPSDDMPSDDMPSDDMSSVEVPQVHPERNNDSQEEPTKPPEETKEESIKSHDEPSGQPINSSPEVELIESSEGGIKEQSKSPDAPEVVVAFNVVWCLVVMFHSVLRFQVGRLVDMF